MRVPTVATAIAALSLAALAGASDHEAATRPAVAKVAVAKLAAIGASGVTGTVTFTERDGKVKLEAELHGLTPGEHGFHIHEWGDCSALDGTSAGSHFNPAGHAHGAPGGEVHAGDLGNVVAGAAGAAKLESKALRFTLSGAESILGRSVIVHEKADDLKTQPTGNAGGRVACGVILLHDGTTLPVKKPEAAPAK
jgi:Cu-Zn family superoxide dismutase